MSICISLTLFSSFSASSSLLISVSGVKVHVLMLRCGVWRSITLKYSSKVEAAQNSTHSVLDSMYLVTSHHGHSLYVLKNELPCTEDWEDKTSSSSSVQLLTVYTLLMVATWEHIHSIWLTCVCQSMSRAAWLNSPSSTSTWQCTQTVEQAL